MPDSPLRQTDEAPPYVVVRLDQDLDTPDGHDHVTAVETRDPDGGSTQWRVVDVIAAIRDGERFVVELEGHDRKSVLEPAVCPACSRATVTVDAAGERPPAT
jgi:hypothetical protein